MMMFHFKWTNAMTQFHMIHKYILYWFSGYCRYSCWWIYILSSFYIYNDIRNNKEISNTSNIYVTFRLWCIIVSGQIWWKFIEYMIVIKYWHDRKYLFHDNFENMRILLYNKYILLILLSNIGNEQTTCVNFFLDLVYVYVNDNQMRVQFCCINYYYIIFISSTFTLLTGWMTQWCEIMLF